MIIHELSKFLSNLKYGDIPQESIDKAKICFIDYLAVYFRGLETDNAKIAIKTIYELYGSNFNSLNKGFINGIASHSLDLDDGHRLAQLHPGTIVFSTVLAMLSNDSFNGFNPENKFNNEYLNISSEEFFEAVIGGYELAILLGSLVNPKHRNQGFHSTGTIGSIVAAAVASKILKLDLEKTENSLGLATTQSAGLLEADHAGTMGKSLHVGNAVCNGILSAYLAKNGFTGGESIIDGKEGFLKAMVCDLDDFNQANEESYENISKYMGEYFKNFHINEVYLKKYPFCRHIHSSIDASLFLKESLNRNLDNLGNLDNLDNLDNLENLENLDNLDNLGNSDNSNGLDNFNGLDNSNGLDNLNNLNNLNFSQIDSIEIKTYKIASEHDNFSPKSPQDLKQSLPYAIAISLVSKDLSLDNIDKLIDNGLLKENSADLEVLEIKELLSKINIVCDDDLDSLSPQKRPSQIVIKFKDDSIEDLECTSYYPLGEMENPLELEDILEKFKDLNPDFDINKLDMIKNMEDYSIKELFKAIGI